MATRAGGLARVGLLGLIWGSAFLWINISLRGFTPVQLTFARLALGAVVLLAWVAHMRLRLPRGRTMWIQLTVAAFFANALPYFLFGWAQQHVASNLAGAINATTPLWTVLVAWLTRTERQLGGLRLLGLILGFVGALLILSPWQGNVDLAGGLAVLVASASYGVSYVYMSRVLLNRGYPTLVLSAAQLCSATGLLALASPYGGFETPAWRTDALVALLHPRRHRHRPRLRP